MTKTLHLTPDEIETLHFLLKAKIFEHDFNAEKRNAPKAAKAMHFEESEKLKAILFQLVG